MLISAQPAWAARGGGVLTLSVVDEQTNEPLAVRCELRDARDRVVRVRAKDAVVTKEGLYFVGTVDLNLSRGAYQFVIDAGPEYRTRPGQFTIDRNAEDSKQITVLRRVDMHDEGWWSGDLDVSHKVADVPTLAQARGLDYVPVIRATNLDGKCKTQKLPRKFQPTTLTSPAVDAGGWLDQRRGNSLLLLGDQDFPNLCKAKADDSSLMMIESAQASQMAVIAADPASWELPLWVASGKLDALQVMNRYCSPIKRHSRRQSEKSAGRPLDRGRYPGPRGYGRYCEHIYHHLLNCGLQIPPAAGSGAAALETPPGRSRVYVQCGEQFTRERWIEGLLAGKVSVTNGPLLRTRVEGKAPGHVFTIVKGRQREFQISLNLAFYEASQVEYLEILKNGRSVYEVRLDELAKQRGKLPPVVFDSSGWFLVRAVTDETSFYQYATTGPYYVLAEERPRVSRASVQFFLDWLDDAEKHFAESPARLLEVAGARSYWSSLLAGATAD